MALTVIEEAAMEEIEDIKRFWIPELYNNILDIGNCCVCHIMYWVIAIIMNKMLLSLKAPWYVVRTITGVVEKIAMLILLTPSFETAIREYKFLISGIILDLLFNNMTVNVKHNKFNWLFKGSQNQVEITQMIKGMVRSVTTMLIVNTIDHLYVKLLPRYQKYQVSLIQEIHHRRHNS